jgi:hypothetical protein
VKFASGRAYEETYLIDFSSYYKIHLFPMILSMKYTDSANRITSMWTNCAVKNDPIGASDKYASMEALLSRHGEALRQYGPRYFRIYRKAQILYSFLAGWRRQGAKLSFRYLADYPLRLDGWVVLLAGLVGPQALATVKHWKHLWQKRHNIDDQEKIL